MGMITVVEKIEESGVKGWTARGVWENADIGMAFVEEGSGWIYIQSVLFDDRPGIIEFDERGLPRVFTCLEDFEDICGGTLTPVNLRIEWERE